jgi:hypothetical protein
VSEQFGEVLPGVLSAGEEQRDAVSVGVGYDG